MSLGTALANDLARLFALLLLLPFLTFAAGWYCGDRLDLPSVSVEFR